jgi:predicted anti-sigma-YlaC factor YlaD
MANQNREEFIHLLRSALKIDIKANKDLVLTNIISKNRAKWLLESIDEFFY